MFEHIFQRPPHVISSFLGHRDMLSRGLCLYTFFHLSPKFKVMRGHWKYQCICSFELETLFFSTYSELYHWQCVHIFRSAWCFIFHVDFSDQGQCSWSCGSRIFYIFKNVNFDNFESKSYFHQSPKELQEKWFYYEVFFFSFLLFV